MDKFTEAYVECALWASTDHNGESMDIYDTDCISAETMNAIKEDCAAFLADYAELIEDRNERAGMDFYLTRNRHGSGFWDGDWQEQVGKELTRASHSYGEFNLYVGDDGLIYHHN